MERLFAPWRIEWVEREDRNAEIDGCIFCALPDLEAEREHRLVARTEGAFVLLNHYPYNPGHAMVIPEAHVGDYAALDEAAILAKERLLSRTIRAMDAAFAPQGYNVGYNLGGSAAGGSIDDHLHGHVVPRWDGDTNFMPVIGESKVIVEAVDETYDRLHEAYAAQDGATDPGPERAVVFE